MKLKLTAVAVGGLCMSGCSTIQQSFELGAISGGLGGGLATFAAHASVDGKATLGQVGIGAGIGLGAGLLTSYFVHKAVAEDREQAQAEDTEMHFGDLPPSPFVVPNITKRRGQ